MQSLSTEERVIDLDHAAIAYTFAGTDGDVGRLKDMKSIVEECGDDRMTLVYKILRRIRRAALASGVSRDMFALSCALSLMMTFRMAFRYNRFYTAANGMLNAAKEIVRRL